MMFFRKAKKIRELGAEVERLRAGVIREIDRVNMYKKKVIELGTELEALKKDEDYA